MERLEKFGLPKRIIAFVLPTGYSFNLAGSTLYLAVASVFAAQAAGIDMPLGRQLLMMLTLMLTSKGVAAVPRAALVILSGALTMFGLPLQAVAVMLGVDALLDMARTSINLLGNCLATAVMARWEGEFPRQSGSVAPMSGTSVQFPSNGHTCDGYLAVPPKGSGPGLIVLQEWWGLVDHIKTLCDRFAAEGFVALAPDLYHGERTTSPDQAGKLLMALNIAEAGKDMRGAAVFLRGHGAVKPKRVGILGFCMGGQLALYAGQEFPDVIDAVVDFYGIHPKVEIVPGPREGAGARPLRDARQGDAAGGRAGSASACQKAGGTFDVHEYEADHAFFNDTRPQVYDAAAATLSFSRTLTFLRKTLA